jgi:hypothetical protein
MVTRYVANFTAAAGYSTHVLVTPNDSTTVDFDAIYIGTTGNVAFKLNSGAAVKWTAVPAGTIIPGNKITAVMSTDTSASNIVGLTY